MGQVRTLSFTLNIDTRTTDADETPANTPYRVVEARPLADGLPLTTRYIFDAGILLAYRLRSDTLDLFTCSCGAAGCAGIHDSVSLDVTDTVVRWVFPEEPFRDEFNPALFPASEPLILTFNREQYSQALHQLEADLIAAAAEGPFLHLEPLSYPDFDQTLDAKLAGAKRWVDQLLAEKARRIELFGPLTDKAILVQFPNGARRQTYVMTLAYDYAWRLSEVYAISRDEALARVAAEWRQNQTALFDALLDLPWEEVRPLLGTLPGDDRSQVPQQGDWARVKVSLVAES